MALVKFGAGVSDMRGKEGGVIFSRNAYGAYMKAKVSPVNPQSGAQQDVRNRLQNISQSWNELSAGEKSAYNDLGAIATRTNVFGDTTNYTGFGIYMRLGLNRAVVGASPLAAAPVIPTLPGLVITAVIPSESGGDFTINMTPNPVGTGFYLVCYATQQMNSGRSFVKNLRRFIVAAENQGTGWDIMPEYGGLFGALVEGNTIHTAFKLIHTASGFDTPLQVQKTLVVA